MARTFLEVYEKSKQAEEALKNDVVLDPNQQVVANIAGEEETKAAINMQEFFNAIHQDPEVASNAYDVAVIGGESNVSIRESAKIAWDNASTDLLISEVGQSAIAGSITPEEARKRIEELRKLKKPEISEGFNSWIYAGVNQLPRQIVASTTGGVAGIATAPAGFLIGAGTGTPVGATIGAAAAFSAGFTGGVLYENAMIGSGLTYADLITMKDSAGNHLNPSYAKWASVASGAVESALETVIDLDVLKTAGKAIKKLDKFKNGSVSKTLAVSVLQTLINGAKRQGINYATELPTELAQEGTNLIIEEVTKAISNSLEDTDFNQATKDQIIDRGVQTVIQTFKSTTGLTLPSNVLHTTIDLTDASLTTVKDLSNKKIIDKFNRNVPTIIPRIDIDNMGGVVVDADKYPQSLKERVEKSIADLQSGKEVMFGSYEEAVVVQRKIADHYEANKIDAKVEVVGRKLRILPVEEVETAQKDTANSKQQQATQLLSEADVKATIASSFPNMSSEQTDASYTLISTIAKSEGKSAEQWFSENIYDMKYSEQDQPSSDATLFQTSTIQPKKTIKAYKAFRLVDGQLYPMFVDADKPLPVGEWIEATEGGYHFTAANGRDYTPAKTGVSIPIPDDKTRQELFDKGIIKSLDTKSVKCVSYRPGWHASSYPFFPQAGVRAKNKSADYAYDNYHAPTTVIAEVELMADKDYKQEFEDTAIKTKDGKINTLMSGLRNIPSGGYYEYVTNPLIKNKPDSGTWYISGGIKINKILSRDETNQRLSDNNIPIQKWADEVDSLKQDTNGNVKAMVQFVEDGKAIVTAFKSHDFSSFVHEIGHILRRKLNKENTDIIEKEFGVTDGKWTREQEEQFANSFEVYLKENKANNPEIASVFGKIKEWLVAIYNSISQSKSNIKLSPSVEKVFNNVVLGNVTPNLYIGNVTSRMKRVMAGEFGVNPEDIKSFEANGWSTKRKGIELTREEATEALDLETEDLMDKLANNRLNTDEDIAYANAQWGNIKELRRVLDLPQGKCPFRVFRSKEKTVLIYDKSVPLYKDSKAELQQLAEDMELPTDGTKADILERIEQALDNLIEPQDKIVSEAKDNIKGKVIKTDKLQKVIKSATKPDTLQTVEMSELDRLNLVMRKVQAATNKGWRLAKSATAQLNKIKQSIIKRNRMIKRISLPVSKNIAVEYAKAVRLLQDKIDFKAKDKAKDKKDATRQALANDPTLRNELPKELLESLDKKDIDDLTYQELQQIFNEVKRLKHLGAIKSAFLRKDFKIKVEQIKADIIKSLNTQKKGRQKLFKATNKERVATLNPIRMFEALDGMTENGTLYKFFYEQADIATDNELTNTDIRHSAFYRLLKTLNYGVSRLHEKVIVDGVQLTKENIMMLYAGWLDPDAQLAMIYGGIDTKVDGKKQRFYPTAEFREKAIAKLSQEEILIAKTIQEDYKNNKERIRSAVITAENRDMGFIENYIKIRRLWDAATPRPDKEKVVGLDDDLTLEVNQRIWNRTVGAHKNFTLDRKNIPDEYQTPIDWRLCSVWLGEVKRQEHYISHAMLLKQWRSVFKDKDVRATIVEKAGEAPIEAIEKFINGAANPDYYKTYGMLDKMSNYLRKAAYATALLYKYMIGAKQFVAYSFYLPKCGAFRWFYTPFDFVNDYDNNVRFVDEHAPQILHSNFEGEFADFKRGYDNNYRLAVSKLGEVGGWAIVVADRFVKRVGWLATYKDVYAKTKNHDEAVRAATKATNATQNAALAKDLPVLYKTNDFLKWFTMFTNQTSQIYGMYSHDVFMSWLNKDYRKFALTILGLSMSATAMWSLSRGRLPEDEDELTEAQIEAMISIIPLVGSQLSAGWSGYSSQAPMPLTAVNKIGKGLKQISEDDINEGLKNISKGLGCFAGVPQSLSNKAFDVLE